MNYWLTALAAHASDMSSWLFSRLSCRDLFTQGLIRSLDRDRSDRLYVPQLEMDCP
jgi:hypothetical protein